MKKRKLISFILNGVIALSVITPKYVINAEETEHHFGDPEYVWNTDGTLNAVAYCQDEGCEEKLEENVVYEEAGDTEVTVTSTFSNEVFNALEKTVQKNINSEVASKEEDSSNEASKEEPTDEIDEAAKEAVADKADTDDSYLVEEENEEGVSVQSDGDVQANIIYSTHVQNDGWKGDSSNGANSGTTGQSKRIEAIKINVSSNVSGGVTYRVHGQDYGWQGWKQGGEVAGTTGQSRRVEAIEIKLTGDLANYYDVYYRTHVQNLGWQNWSSNGGTSGTTGRSLRIECIQIQLVKKGEGAPSNESTSAGYVPHLSYKAHVQDYGWLGNVSGNGVAGTTGQSKRVEAFTMSVDTSKVSGGIEYKAHVQNVGWQGWVSNGAVAGTTGRSLQVEAIAIRLTGDLANKYDIYYRVHVANDGWMGWAKNGEYAGTSGRTLRVEAMQVTIVKKGDSAPGGTGNHYSEMTQYTPTYYSQRDGRWSGATYSGYSLYSTGCVPTSVAMAVDGILHNGVNPKTAADYLVTTGEFAGRKHGGSGLAIKYGAEHWGLKTSGINSYNSLVSCLNAGNIVVFQVGAGTFTSRGTTHAIVLFRSSGGNTYVYDPLNIHNGWYSISMIWNQRSTNSYDLTGGYVGYGIYK